MIDGLLESAIAMAGAPLLLILLGTLVGIVFGAIPGLNGGMLVALTLPLTYGWNPLHAIALLVGQYVGSISGGLLSATLLNIPGTAASLMTTMDATPMARAGQPERALQIGIMASFAGGIVSWLALVFLSPLLAKWALVFGPHEYFSLVLVSLMLISSLSGDSLVKAMIAAMLGMLVGMIGWDKVTGQSRLTFGIAGMDAGLDILAILVGVFAVSQLLIDTLPEKNKAGRFAIRTSGLQIRVSQFLKHWPNLIRSSVIGTVVGILPGVGGSIGSIIAYTSEKSISRNSDKFGSGCEEGIVASETANNATVGGALVPLITMGIPGSIVDVVLIAALTMHYITPGPLLFQNEPQVVYGFMNSFLFSNIAMLIMMLLGIRFLARLIDVPKTYLVPTLLLICVIGTYAMQNSLFDVWVMLVFGIIALWFRFVGIPVAPFVIGLVLAPIAEENFRMAIIGSEGRYLSFVEHPISATFLALAGLVAFLPLMRRKLSSGEAPNES